MLLEAVAAGVVMPEGEEEVLQWMPPCLEDREAEAEAAKLEVVVGARRPREEEAVVVHPRLDGHPLVAAEAAV